MGLNSECSASQKRSLSCMTTLPMPAVPPSPTYCLPLPVLALQVHTCAAACCLAGPPLQKLTKGYRYKHEPHVTPQNSRTLATAPLQVRHPLSTPTNCPHRPKIRPKLDRTCTRIACRHAVQRCALQMPDCHAGTWARMLTAAPHAACAAAQHGGLRCTCGVLALALAGLDDDGVAAWPHADPRAVHTHQVLNALHVIAGCLGEVLPAADLRSR